VPALAFLPSVKQLRFLFDESEAVESA